MDNKKSEWGELELLKTKLIDLVDEYFPKIKPLGINKGRGEASVIIGIALTEFKKLLHQQRKELIEEVKETSKAKLQIKTIAGEVLFESEKTTLKEAVEEAVCKDAYLRGADLRGADLRGAYLVGADLVGADLVGADLSGADLVGANLTGADLKDANLTGADLVGADLFRTKFYGRGGTTRINKNQVDYFFKALGVIVEV